MASKTTLEPSDHAAKASAIEYQHDLSAYQETIATGRIGGMTARKNLSLKGFEVRAMVCGTAGSSIVHLDRNSVSVGSLTIDNADPDGTSKFLGLDIDLVPGDILEFRVATAPTAGSRLFCHAETPLRFN